MRYVVFVSATLLLLTLVVVTIRADYDHRCNGRVKLARAHIDILRRGIEAFHGREGRYPVSLDEYLRYAGEHAIRQPARIETYVDLTSKKTSDVPEHRELNGEGGYYYDPHTGELRLNLTRPVKEYFRRYNGRYADQVPADW